MNVEFWSTKHQATLICYQKPPGSNTDLNFFFFFTYQKKKFQILYALFLLMIYLFSCRVLKKFMGTCFVIFFLLWMHCLLSYVISDKKLELVILVPTPLSLFQLWIEIWFFKFSMIWVFFGIGYFSFRFKFDFFGIGIG